tara:strand:+ start:2335 stop:2994 length:660 start_codon:yes stop_codon:yes gene_type:complete
MKTLKELTWEHHKEAERQKFVKVLMSGKIIPEIYAIYLANQHKTYDVLEAMAMADGLLDDMPEIRRAPHIKKDFDELWTYGWAPPIFPTTEKYIKYVAEALMDCPEKIMAHIYVRHMGDLSGGQMIKRKIPGAGTMYDFNLRYVEGRNQKYQNMDELKEALRTKVNSFQKYSDASTLTENINNVVYEARTCFNFATNLFKDIDKFINDNEKRFGNGTEK